MCCQFFFLHDSSIIIKHCTLFSFVAILSYLYSVLFIVEGKGTALQPTVIIYLLVGVSFQFFITFSAKWREVSD